MSYPTSHSDGKVEKTGGDIDRSFELFVDQTVKDSIRGMLGESAMQAIIFHLHLEGNFATDAKVFHERLYSVLKAPALIIEEIIVKSMFSKLGLVYAESNVGGFDFARYVETAKSVFLSKQGKKGAGSRL
jgi:hypothetical protein